jgi:hypothetical protein
MKSGGWCQWHRWTVMGGVNDTTHQYWQRWPHGSYMFEAAIDERFERPWQPLKGLSINNIFVPVFSYPPLKKYINLKGLPNKKFSYMRFHWHSMHDFCVRKSIISRRIRNRIKKGFSPWIRGPGGIVWWKNPESRKSRDTVPLRIHSCHASAFATLYLSL